MGTAMPFRCLIGGLLCLAAVLTGIVAVRSPARAALPAAPPPASGAATPCAADEHDLAKAIWKVRHVWGYVDRHSVPTGGRFDLMLSTKPGEPALAARIEVFRQGAPGRKGRSSSVFGRARELVWRSQTVRIDCQEVSSTAAAIGAGWQPTLRQIATNGWRSGFYRIDVVHEDSGIRERDVAYIVVTNPRRAGDILVKLGTNTYQAYNAWGGHSLYGSNFAPYDWKLRGRIVAFDRPTPMAFSEFDRHLVTWLEAVARKNGWTVDYATNFDVHADASFMEGYRLVIVPGHDEYWTKEEFDAFERRIFARGQNTLFLGGDIAYYQVRYADVNRALGSADLGRQLVCYKRNDPIRWRLPEGGADLLVSTRFRDGQRRPETMLTGVGSEGMFTPRSDLDPAYPLYVARTDLPFFAGTGLQPDASIGDIAGYEWGNTDPAGDGTRLWAAERSRNAKLERERLVVLFTGHPRDDKGQEGRAESVYFTSPAGAKVFSAGNIRWPWGLSKLGFTTAAFRVLNENMVRYFLEPRE
jgi:hypothetical protein